MENIKVRENSQIAIFKDADKYALVVSVDKNIKNLEEVKTIFELSLELCQYPSEKLLDCAYTKTLEYYWYQLREHNLAVAADFFAEALKIEGDSYNEHTNERLVIELIKFSADRYYAIWQMIKFSFSYLKQKLPECPNTDRELFFKILEQELNEPFERVIYNDYVSFDVKKIGDVAKEITKACEIETKEIKTSNKKINWEKLEKLSKTQLKTNESSFWYKVLKILNEPSKKLSKDRLFRNAIDDYNKALRYLCDVMHELSTKRTEEGMLISPWVWKDGEVIQNPWGRKPDKSV